MHAPPPRRPCVAYRTEPEYESEWESDVEEADAAWRSDSSSVKKGLTLRELYEQKRMDAIEADMKAMEIEFYKAHADTLDVRVWFPREAVSVHLGSARLRYGAYVVCCLFVVVVAAGGVRTAAGG